MMKIKTKLLLGIGSLLLLITFVTLTGVLNINSLRRDTANILKANYNTLDYSRNMLLAIDDDIKNKDVLNKFEINLAYQQDNITEMGEKEATENLINHFNQLKSFPDSTYILKKVRNDIYVIMMLNMQSIQHKSNVAKSNANLALIFIASTGIICLIIALILFIKLPGNIANPIKELSLSIKQIAAKNYSQRVNYKQNDEFGELAGTFNTMAEKLSEYENLNLSKLLFEKKRIEALINNMTEPIIGFDDKLTIIFANNEALKILGLEGSDLIGKAAKDISIENDLIRSLLQGMSSLYQGQGTPVKDPVKIFADGKESYFIKEYIKIEIVPTGEVMSRHIGDVIVLKNITPFKELDFAKTNFIATISHELKTPVASIKMSLQLLENKKNAKLNEEQKQLVKSIEEDSDRILTIIGELLKLTQVETGNIQLSIQQCNPSDILNYAIETIKMQAEQRKIQFEISLEQGLPHVKADFEKTAWVLINLLSNAIRYSPEKSNIDITVKTVDDKVLFSVKDHGKGIETRYLNRLFDKYFQVPDGSKQGTGLGLAICKEFIEAQGGTIGVESEVGLYSHFFFYLKT